MFADDKFSAGSKLDIFELVICMFPILLYILLPQNVEVVHISGSYLRG
jgi:hypothetical protein